MQTETLDPKKEMSEVGNTELDKFNCKTNKFDK